MRKRQNVLSEIKRNLSLMGIKENNLIINNFLREHNLSSNIQTLNEGIIGDVVTFLTNTFEKPAIKELKSGAKLYTIKNIDFLDSEYTTIKRAIENSNLETLPPNLISKVVSVVSTDPKIIEQNYIDFIREYINSSGNKLSHSDFIKEVFNKRNLEPNKTINQILQEKPFELDPLTSNFIKDQVEKDVGLYKNKKFVDRIKNIKPITDKNTLQKIQRWYRQSVEPDILKWLKIRSKAYLKDFKKPRTAKIGGKLLKINSIEEDLIKNWGIIIDKVEKNQKIEESLIEQLMLIGQINKRYTYKMKKNLEEWLDPLEEVIGKDDMSKFKNSDTYKKYLSDVEESSRKTFEDIALQPLCARLNMLPGLSFLGAFICKKYHWSKDAKNIPEKVIKTILPDFRRMGTLLLWDDPRLASEFINMGMRGGRYGAIAGSVTSYLFWNQVVMPFIKAAIETAVENQDEIVTYNTQLNLLKRLCEKKVITSGCDDLKSLEAKTPDDLKRLFLENQPLYRYFKGLDENRKVPDWFALAFTNIDEVINGAIELYSYIAFSPDEFNTHLNSYSKTLQNILLKGNEIENNFKTSTISELRKLGYKGNTTEELEKFMVNLLNKPNETPLPKKDEKTQFIAYDDELYSKAGPNEEGFIYFLSKYTPPREIANPTDYGTKGLNFDLDNGMGFDKQGRNYFWSDDENRWFEFDKNKQKIDK